jgi:hypothetical protein
MTEYLVTIEPIGEANDAKTVVHVDASGRAPQIRRVEFSATPDHDGSNLAFPQVDLTRLAAAFSTRGEPAAETPAPIVRRGRSTGVGKSRSKKAADDASDSRVYRKMPDATELVGAYHDANSVGELADIYGVPRHTMNGWLARLRRQGLIERR